MSPFADLLPALEAVCSEAARRALEARTRLQKELKPDGSIVTNADREVEAFLRPELQRLVPGSTVWGEELGYAKEGEGGLWVVDPIDGTSNFAFGSPLWGISVGLVKADAIELGAISLPDLGETYLAAKGCGVACTRRPDRRRPKTERLEPIPPGPVRPEELVSYNDSVIRAYGAASVPYKMRCSGAAVVDGAFVARQRFRGFIGFRESLYDFAPALLMGAELGADVRKASGAPMDLAELKRGGRMSEAWLIFPAGSGFVLPPPR